MFTGNAPIRISNNRFIGLAKQACAAGILSTLFFSLHQANLGLVLALFTGFFLYIGASDLLPESHHAHPTKWTTFMTLLGILLMFAVIRVAGI